MDKDVVFLLDEIYIQKDVQYDGGKLIGADGDGNMFKGIMTFMIVSLKKSIPFVVKAIPELQIEGEWLSREISSLLSSVHESGFQVNIIYIVICILHSLAPPHPLLIRLCFLILPLLLLSLFLLLLFLLLLILLLP